MMTEGKNGELKTGDRVRYENVYVCDGKYMSGEGVIISLYEFGYNNFAWVKKDNGRIKSVPCRELEKI